MDEFHHADLVASLGQCPVNASGTKRSASSPAPNDEPSSKRTRPSPGNACATVFNTVELADAILILPHARPRQGQKDLQNLEQNHHHLAHAQGMHPHQTHHRHASPVPRRSRRLDDASLRPSTHTKRLHQRSLARTKARPSANRPLLHPLFTNKLQHSPNAIKSTQDFLARQREGSPLFSHFITQPPIGKLSMGFPGAYRDGNETFLEVDTGITWDDLLEMLELNHRIRERLALCEWRAAFYEEELAGTQVLERRRVWRVQRRLVGELEG